MKLMCLISGLLRMPITLWKLFENDGATFSFFVMSAFFFATDSLSSLCLNAAPVVNRVRLELRLSRRRSAERVLRGKQRRSVHSLSSLILNVTFLLYYSLTRTNIPQYKEKLKKYFYRNSIWDQKKF